MSTMKVVRHLSSVAINRMDYLRCVGDKHKVQVLTMTNRVVYNLIE